MASRATGTNQNQDIAYSRSNRKYDTGRHGRTRKLIIRFESRVQDGETWANDALNIIDTTTAGKEWTEAELDTDNAFREDIAVVVGELIPLAAVDNVRDLISVLEEDGPDDVGYPLIPTHPEARIVIKPLAKDDKGFMVLNNRQANGLCLASELPHRVEASKRLFYYSEWLTDDAAAINIVNKRQS